jgi:hypothetical protein
MSRVTIVGGGLTGILAAFQAHRLGATGIELYERFDQLGGVALPVVSEGRELREGCIYFGPKGDPIRSLLQAHGVTFQDFDNRFGSMSPGEGEPVYVEDFGGPAIPASDIGLRPMRGSSLGDRLACYPDELAIPLARYVRWHLGCNPQLLHESAAVPLAINRVFPMGADIEALAEAKRTDALANELLAIPRSSWSYKSNVQASLPVGGFTGLLVQCREALQSIGVEINERQLVSPRAAIAGHRRDEVLVWAANPTPLFKAVGLSTPKLPPKRFATYIYEARWTGPLPFYVQNFTATGSCFRVYVYESAGKVMLTAECVAECAGDDLASEIHRMLQGFEGELTVGDLLCKSVKPRWIYHSVDTMEQMSKLRSELAARTGPGFVPGAWEPYAKGEKFNEVGAALAAALGIAAVRAA